MTHYALITPDGDALDAVELAAGRDAVGSVIYRGAEPDLRIIDVIVADDPEQFTILVVEET